MSTLDLDLGLLQSILREGMGSFLDQGLSGDLIEGQALVGFRFIEDHWKAHKTVPQAETVYQETGVNVNLAPVEPLSFWCENIKKRALYENLRDGLGKVTDFMEGRNPEKAYAELESTMFRIRNQTHASNRARPFFEKPEEIRADYERAKTGITGVPTMWPTLNKITKGWQPGDVALIAARPGVGKTFLLMISALWAWESGHRVLMGSTEMSHESLLRRMSSLICRLSYSKIRDGQLTSMEEDIFFKKIDELKDDKRLLLLGDGFDVTLNSLEAGIIEEKPDLVCADGMYLFKNTTTYKSRHESVGSVFENFKALAKRNKVPILGTTQMNRPPKVGSAVADLSRLAFSDNAGMIADWVFFIKQTKEMKQNKQLDIQPIKVRETDFQKDIKINWNFATQDFTELNVANSEDDINDQINDLQRDDYPDHVMDEIPEEADPF